MKKDSMTLFKENIELGLTFIIFILFIAFLGIAAYNFLANSEDKIYDDNNKYTNSNLTNFTTTYENKVSFDNNILGVYKGLSKLQKIFIGLFLAIFFLGFILKNRDYLVANLRNLFD